MNKLGPATRQFLADAAWTIPSAASLQNGGCLELRALRKSWLAALAENGITEDQANETGRGLYSRAPVQGEIHEAEPIGYAANRVMTDMNRKRRAVTAEIAAENAGADATAEQITAGIERLKKGQS